MEIAMLLSPNLTQLDLTGPYEVLARLPGAHVHLVAAAREPVRSEHGLAIVPTATFDEIGAADVVFVPGGHGQIAATADAATMAWLRGLRARWITSACTGALLLGAAGLLRGYRAATHWAFLEYDPAPAYPGHPRTAPAELVASIRAQVAARYAERRALLTSLT